MEEIKEAIKKGKLTKTAQIIADFVIDHEEEACFMTSTDIAVRLEVSESSVIRFARALGFTGFMDFQKNLRKTYSKKVASISSNITVPSERLIQSVSTNGGQDYMEVHFKNVVNDIRSVVQKNSQKIFDDAADIILKSHRKFIISSRANAGVGSYMHLLLKHMLDGVYSTNQEALNVIDILSDADERDCAIVFSFPRYSQLDLSALEMVTEQGTKVIVFTDRPSSPAAQYAAVEIIVDVDTSVFFNSYTGVQFAMETLCVALSKKLGSSNEKKLNRIDKYLGRHGLF